MFGKLSKMKTELKFYLLELSLKKKTAFPDALDAGTFQLVMSLY